MCEEFAAFQRRLAPLNSLDKAVFFFEIARDNILHDLIRIDTLLSCALCQPGLQVRSEPNIHSFKI